MNVSPFRRNSAVLEPDETTRRLLAEGATATRTGSGCTPKAMRGNADGLALKLTQVLDLPYILEGPWDGQVTGLIEITIEQATLPIDANETAAHHRLEIVGVVGLDQQLLIGLELPLQLQLPGKALHGHVSQG